MNNIKIGTLVNGHNAVDTIRQIKKYGFETFAITFWQNALNHDLEEIAKRVKEELQGTNITISSLGVYGNPLAEDEEGLATRESFIKLIKSAKFFDTDIVAGFAGGVTGQSIDKSMGKYKEVFSEIAKAAGDEGIKIAFENCPMGGNWNDVTMNIAINPTAWEMMFNELPLDNIGLQWEPCHQMLQFIDPIAQLRKWNDKIFNVHGKDATIAMDIVREKGILSEEQWGWHRTPGFGDTNWTDIISILRMNGYSGSIDIEGWHDPVYSGELEYTGQVHGLNYLKQCRGGDFIPNPV